MLEAILETTDILATVWERESTVTVHLVVLKVADVNSIVWPGDLNTVTITFFTFLTLICS